MAVRYCKPDVILPRIEAIELVEARVSRSIVRGDDWTADLRPRAGKKCNRDPIDAEVGRFILHAIVVYIAPNVIAYFSRLVESLIDIAVNLAWSQCKIGCD